MKKLIIGILIYLAGVLCAYNIGKNSIKDHNKQRGIKDRVQDKIFVSVIASGSWLSVAGIKIGDYLIALDTQKEIKW